jgi:hypothetical protein
MARASLAERVAALETEVARLKEQLQGARKAVDPWTTDVWGAFANDPALWEAMRIGREYREGQRPGRRKPRRR